MLGIIGVRVGRKGAVALPAGWLFLCDRQAFDVACWQWSGTVLSLPYKLVFGITVRTYIVMTTFPRCDPLLRRTNAAAA